MQSRLSTSTLIRAPTLNITREYNPPHAHHTHTESCGHGIWFGRWYTVHGDIIPSQPRGISPSMYYTHPLTHLPTLRKEARPCIQHKRKRQGRNTNQPEGRPPSPHNSKSNASMHKETTRNVRWFPYIVLYTGHREMRKNTRTHARWPYLHSCTCVHGPRHVTHALPGIHTG